MATIVLNKSNISVIHSFLCDTLISLIINNLLSIITRLRLFHSRFMPLYGGMKWKKRSLVIIDAKLNCLQSNPSMSHRKRNELLTYYCLKQFSDYFGARLRLFHFMPHEVEKTESSNNRAQIVYNQTHQCLSEKEMNH